MRGLPPKRVLGRPHQCTEAIGSLHDEGGHHGPQTIYKNVSRRYQWKCMHDDILKYVKSCEECQRRAWIRYEEPLPASFSRSVIETLGLDVVFMPETPEGYKYAVFARDDLSGWLEGRLIIKNDSKTIAKFV
jgi:Integrase zinc binding domain